MDRSRALASVEWLATATGTHSVDAWVTLGSGWGPLTSPWPAPQWTVDLGEVPGFTKPVAEGHLGSLSLFALEGVAVLVSSGRTHLYEGLGVRPVVHGVRTAAALGASMVVLTNANGSLRPDFEIGQPVIIRDHINATGVSPIEGAHFVDLTDAWSPRLRAIAHTLDPTLAEGVYCQLRGPHYNTAAEADWLRRVGGDLVGMSTIPEAIAAREAGMEVFGLSTVTAIEGSSEVIDPSEVVAAAERTASGLGGLIADLLVRGAGEKSQVDL